MESYAAGKSTVEELADRFGVSGRSGMDGPVGLQAHGTAVDRHSLVMVGADGGERAGASHGPATAG